MKKTYIVHLFRDAPEEHEKFRAPSLRSLRRQAAAFCARGEFTLCIDIEVVQRGQTTLHQDLRYMTHLTKWPRWLK